MSAKGDPRARVLNQVIAMELEMFMAVRTSEPSACQEHPEAFRVMRWMTHSVLPEELLLSYLEDLEQAKRTSRNLMTEKYARMDDRIPKIKESPLIKDILDIETKWAAGLAQKYPLTFKVGSAGFKNYLSCELETFSDRTLELYHKVVTEAEREDRNLVEERYSNLFKRLGYGSIEGREQAAKSVR